MAAKITTNFLGRVNGLLPIHWTLSIEPLSDKEAKMYIAEVLYSTKPKHEGRNVVDAICI